MEHSEFNRLYDNGEISVKIFQAVEEDGTEKIVESFEYGGKYYLRIHNVFRYICDRSSTNGKKYRMSKDSHFIKEFNTKERANNYFLKISNNFKRVM